MVNDDLTKGLEMAKGKTGNITMTEWDYVQHKLECCGVHNATDWGDSGCLVTLKTLFEDHFLTTGISVIVLCIIEVLGMCFAMTLFCHISRSGLGYKL
ncbi:Leukocyte surface antigen CD53 [Dissostichus eleginoides]|uniref:Leukocyte surface antigen CD53 n=1 Tax=Dissostichus eleginoides TaxID=100907 RepID=A0AAD9F9G8_DISEL|nr:Leukocyte surface antigen CD53 [Dissostichus eleginoides]